MATKSKKKVIGNIAEQLRIDDATGRLRAEDELLCPLEMSWYFAGNLSKARSPKYSGTPPSPSSVDCRNISISHARLIIAISEKYLHDLDQMQLAEFHLKTLYAVIQYESAAKDRRRLTKKTLEFPILGYPEFMLWSRQLTSPPWVATVDSEANTPLSETSVFKS